MSYRWYDYLIMLHNGDKKLLYAFKTCMLWVGAIIWSTYQVKLWQQNAEFDFKTMCGNPHIASHYVMTCCIQTTEAHTDHNHMLPLTS